MAVVEVIQFRTKPGVTDEEFASYGKETMAGYTSRQPGFQSFEHASAEAGSRLIVIHWDSAAAAQASGAKFADDPATRNLVGSIDMATFTMAHHSTH